MRILFIVSVLLLACIASAEEISLTIFEQKDFGPSYEEDFDDIEVTMNCGEEMIYVQIEDEDVPVTGAIVRIVYVDYSTPLLASGPTDAEGEFGYILVGEMEYMKGLFLVVVEKEGYKQKEAHFDISNCLGYEEGEPGTPLIYDTTPPTIPEPKTPETEPGSETPEMIPEPMPEPGPRTEENLSEIPEFNETENTTADETGEQESTEPHYLCASSFILLLAAILLVLYH